jgi:predicted outer membrane protein
MESRSLKGMALAFAAFAGLAAVAHAASQPASASAAPAAQGQAQAASPGTAAPGTAAPATPAAAPDLSVLSDADILGLNLAIDTNEIEAAKGAEKKKMGKEAMSYAKMLRKEHAKDADKTLKLGTTLGMAPSMPAVAVDLRAKGTADWATIASLEGAAFEKAYIDAMVNGHTEALQLIDSRMVPNAKDARLKQHLTELRSHVASHLEQGKRLQGAQAAKQAE